MGDITIDLEDRITGFIRYETHRGIRNTTFLPHLLRPFFRYLDSIGLPVQQLSFKGAQEFQTYLTTLETKTGKPHYATLSVKTIVSMATRFYNYLKSLGVVYTNPFLGIKRIRTEKKLPANIPEEKKMNRILEDLSRFWQHENLNAQRMYYKTHVMAELQYATGMRIKEVMDLREQDIDFDRRMIRIKSGKGNKERTAFLTEYASNVLYLYVKEMRQVVNQNRESERVFGFADRSTVTDVYHKYLKAVCSKYGIGRFTSHNFRHTLGFHLLRRGCDMRFIQIILGHEDMNTTTIYTKVDKGDLKNELDRHHPRRFARG